MQRRRAPYRVPPGSAPIAWPDTFGTRFTVFVDVEEEFDWTAPFDAAQRATTAMAAFPAAHARFADRGVALACMIDHPIATDPASIDILRGVVADGRSEIGTQLHPWVNPPFAAMSSARDSFAGNLPRSLEAAKLAVLTDAIEAAFGRQPRAYRAGRYGIGPATLETLAAHGYRIDSSMRARYDYARMGGPDFRRIGSHAFRRAGLIELPLTTVFTGVARRAGPVLYPALGHVSGARAAFARAGMLARVALTPEDMPITAALEAVEIAVGEGVRLLNLSFHSPTLVPGHTPYVRDAADLVRFHQWWAAMLDRLDRLGVRNASLQETLDAAG